MSYMLRKHERSRGTYLQIVESFWDAEQGKTRKRSIETPGYVSDLIEAGIVDPVAVYTKRVADMNAEQKRQRKEQAAVLIGASPKREIGYFPAKRIFNKLAVEPYLDLLQSTRNFEFRIADLLQALVYARIVDPCSKKRTLEEVFPVLFERYSFSYDQVLDGIGFLGQNYEKIVEIFTVQTKQIFGIDISQTFMDCTNFWFEIDREDFLRRKGPSKENRHDPIVGLGLLLDKNLRPIGLKLFPGNQSEKPILREMISDLKTTAGIEGKTIQVADKGLNCADNIFAAVSAGDGYLFSKSVKQLPETEKNWLLLGRGWKHVKDADGRLIYKYKSCVADFPYRITEPDGGKRTVELPEKRVATFNPKLAEKKKLEIARQVNKAKELKAAGAKRDKYGDSAKYVKFQPADKKGKVVEGKITTELNEEKIQEDLKLAGYNLLITSETGLSCQKIYDTYHSLWRIEESFKIMKSYLDARPVFLHRTDTISGHFLICYLCVLLIRLFQFDVLENKFGTETLVNFMKSLTVVPDKKGSWINISTASKTIDFMSDFFHLPIRKYYIRTPELEKCFIGKI